MEDEANIYCHKIVRLEDWEEKERLNESTNCSSRPAFMQFPCGEGKIATAMSAQKETTIVPRLAHRDRDIYYHRVRCRYAVHPLH